MLSSPRPGMITELHTDMRRALHRRGAVGLSKALRVLFNNQGLQALVIYRFGRTLDRLEVSLSGKLLAALIRPVFNFAACLVRKAYGIDLDQSADIAPGLFIGHFGGIALNRCRIGPHCAIQQQVRLEPATTGEAGPVLGAGVWVGAHARIYGPVSVGNGATIGAGAVVTEDVPARCLVLGNPGRIAQRDYDNHAFL